MKKILFLAFIILITGYSCSNPQQNTIEQQQKQIDELNKKIEKINNEDKLTTTSEKQTINNEPQTIITQTNKLPQTNIEEENFKELLISVINSNIKQFQNLIDVTNEQITLFDNRIKTINELISNNEKILDITQDTSIKKIFLILGDIYNNEKENINQYKNNMISTQNYIMTNEIQNLNKHKDEVNNKNIITRNEFISNLESLKLYDKPWEQAKELIFLIAEKFNKLINSNNEIYQDAWDKISEYLSEINTPAPTINYNYTLPTIPSYKVTNCYYDDQTINCYNY